MKWTHDRPLVDFVEDLNRFPVAQACAVLSSLSLDELSAILDEPTLTRREALVESLSPERAGAALERIGADERHQILQALSQESRERLLARLSPARRALAETVLRYPPHSAGALMTTGLVRLDQHWRVGQALEHVRSVAAERESIYTCYVVNAQRELLGVVSLRELLLAPDDRPLLEVMNPRPIRADVRADQETVAGLFSKYNLLALPIVEGRRLVGFITVDDAIDIIVEEGTEDMLRLGAVQTDPVEAGYFETPLTAVVRKRVGWLMLLFLAETLTGTVLRHFEAELASMVALAFFVPLLIGTGGNAGSQTTTTVVRALALGQIRGRDAVRVWARESATGLLVGLLIASVALVRAQLWGSPWSLSLTVALTVVIVCCWATSVGALIPLLAQRLRIDPAVLSAPLITTLVDATGLVIYFEVARHLIGFHS